MAAHAAAEPKTAKSKRAGPGDGIPTQKRRRAAWARHAWSRSEFGDMLPGGHSPLMFTLDQPNQSYLTSLRAVLGHSVQRVLGWCRICYQRCKIEQTSAIARGTFGGRERLAV